MSGRAGRQQVVLVDDTRSMTGGRRASRARELGSPACSACRFGWTTEARGAEPVQRPSRSIRRGRDPADQLFGTHAALALAEAHRVEQLQAALRNRDLIGQAKGILIERHRLTPDDAFRRLSEVSQSINLKLTAVAQHLVDTGELLDRSPVRGRRSGLGAPLGREQPRPGGAVQLPTYGPRRPVSLIAARAAFHPQAPCTPPPGCAEALAR